MSKSYREININDRNKVVDYYYKHKDISIDNIAINLNISDRAVRRVLKEEGINTRLKNRYILDENYFDCIDTEAKAYILGFIYADGFVGDEKFNNIVISVNDLEILEFIAKEFEFTGNIRKTKKGGFENSKSGYSLNFSSNCFMILGTKAFLEEIIKEAEFNYAKIYDTKSEKIKCIRISAKKEFDNIFKYLYDNSTIKLERKYNKWNEIKSAFAAGAVKKIG